VMWSGDGDVAAKFGNGLPVSPQMLLP
jgi:hypothetical protein